MSEIVFSFFCKESLQISNAFGEQWMDTGHAKWFFQVVHVSPVCFIGETQKVNAMAQATVLFDLANFAQEAEKERPKLPISAILLRSRDTEIATSYKNSFSKTNRHQRFAICLNQKL